MSKLPWPRGGGPGRGRSFLYKKDISELGRSLGPERHNSWVYTQRPTQTACKRIGRAPTISALRAAVDGDEVLGLRVAQYNRARGKQPETELLLSQLARDPSRRK